MIDESLVLPLLGQTSLVESTDIPIFPVKTFVYDDTIDTSTIQNVLFINSVVTNFQQYANANTFPIIYSRLSTREQMMELLTSKFQNISRIAIVCHFSEQPYFLNYETLFSDTNIQFIVDLVKQFNVVNIDYLACSTLQSQVWTSYYTKIHDTTGITIGASDDNTGNLKYSGDWILESTQEDIQTIYFNDIIQNYASILTDVIVNEVPTIAWVVTILVAENIPITTVLLTAVSNDVVGATNTFSISGTDMLLFNFSLSGELTFISPPNYETNPSYHILIVSTDQYGLYASQAVTIKITNVNEAPTITCFSTVTVDENIPTTTVFLTAVSNDVDASATNIYSMSGNDVSSFNIDSSGQLTFMSPPNYEVKSSYSITIITTDQDGLYASQAVNIIIANVNEAPTITCLSTVTVDENIPITTVLLIAVSNDVDASATNTFSITGTDWESFIITSSGQLKFKESPNYEVKSSYNINVVTTDTVQGELYASQAVSIIIANVNEVPTITCDGTVTVDENIPITSVFFTAISNDVDASATNTFSITGTDRNSFIITSSGQLKFKESPNYEVKSSYSINVVTTDQGGLYASQAVTIIIAGVNESPTITCLSTVTFDENIPITTVLLTAVSNDVDASATNTFSITGVDWESFNIDPSGHLTFKESPNYDVKSSYSINVVTTDQYGLYASHTVTISIAHVNKAPTIVCLDTVTFAENIPTTTVLLIATSNDVDPGATNTFSISGTDRGSFNIDPSGHLTFISSPNYEVKSSYSINVVTTDQGALYASQAVTIIITNANDAPTITCLSTVTVDENIPIETVLLTAISNDVDTGATNTFSITGADWESFNIDPSGHLKFISYPNYEVKSSYSINVLTTDTIQSELYASRAVTITIRNVNEAPTIVCNDTVTVDENIPITSVLLNATSNDVDTGATNTFSISGIDYDSFIITSSGYLKFKESPNYEAKSSYSINVVTTDQGALYASRTVTIIIRNVNDAPVAPVLINQTVNQNVFFTYIFDTFTDVDANDMLSYTATNVPSWVAFNSELRKFSGLPTKSNVGTNTITVIATDLSNVTKSATFVLTVVNLNDDPTGGVFISGTAAQNQTLTADTSLLGDVDGLGLFLFQWDASGVNISGATSSTFVLTQAQVGKPIGVTIKYTDLRGTLETVSSTKTVPVENVNDTPTISLTQTATLTKGSLIKSGTTDASDIDIGAVLTWSISNKIGTYGSIDISSTTGAWQYILSNNSDAYKALENDISANDTFIINVTDGSLNTTQSLKIIIIGVTIAAVAPQSFTLAAGDGEITIDNVIDVSNGAIVDFHIYSKSLDGSNWGPDMSLNSLSTQTVLTGLTNGQVYYIKLKSHNTVGYSAYSNVLSKIPQTHVSITGTILDGYIRDASITIKDLSGVLYGTSVITDQNGNFTMSAILQPHTTYIIASVGGVDIATNLAVTSPLTRIYITDTIVVSVSNLFTSPLTTMVANIVSSGETFVVATTKVATTMGISESDITSDYIGVPNVSVGVAAVKVATLVNMIVATTSSQGYTGEEISKAVSQTLFNSTGTGPVDFTSPSLISNIVAAADVINVAAPSINVITATNLSSIMAQVSTTLDTIKETGSNSVSDLASIYKTSIGAQAVITDNQDNISNITIPNVSTALDTAINVATVGNVKGNICFRKGTKVVTDQGIIEIQKITEKNSINAKKILLVSKTTNIDDYMVLIQKDALYNNVPNADTYVTGEHKVFFNREMIKTKKLVNGTTIRKVTALNEEVYNLLLEGDNVGKMIANGLIGETLNPKSMMIELLLKLNKMGLKERTEEIHKLNYFSKMDQDRRMMKK